MLTGEEDSRVCEDVEVEEMDGGGGGEKEEVKKLANEEAWKGVPVWLEVAPKLRHALI